MSKEQAIIVEACRVHKESNWKQLNYRAAISIGTDCFVKFGAPRTLLPEIITQKYIWDHARADPTKPGRPRIPEVRYYFIHQQTMYMVVEFIKLVNSPPDINQRRAVALRWLSEVPLPPNHVFGPLAGGHIRHKFFKDRMAPLDFSSVEALERYMELARTRFWNRGRQLQPINISGERSIFMQPDDDLSNFGVDDLGNTVMMDFAEIAPLPLSFAAYTITSNPGLTALAESLGLLNNPNLTSMAAISSVLWMVGDAKLGLNNDGFPKTKTLRRTTPSS